MFTFRIACPSCWFLNPRLYPVNTALANRRPRAGGRLVCLAATGAAGASALAVLVFAGASAISTTSVECVGQIFSIFVELGSPEYAWSSHCFKQTSTTSQFVKHSNTSTSLRVMCEPNANRTSSGSSRFALGPTFTHINGHHCHGSNFTEIWMDIRIFYKTGNIFCRGWNNRIHTGYISDVKRTRKMLPVAKCKKVD